jgi:hypothetical protein
MLEWWNALPLDQQIYWAIGLLSTTVTTIQMVLLLLGMGGDALDLDLPEDMPDGDSSSGVGIFSSQTIFAFLTGFGWGGVAATGVGIPTPIAVFIAFGAGGVTMTAMYFLLVGMLSLEDKGNLDYGAVVGSLADVYVTIPGSLEHGKGQIQVVVSGRLTNADASTEHLEPIKTGRQVRVIKQTGPTSFLVEPA